MKKNLPKLLYIGDISVEETVASPVFFYRLLYDYPSEKLEIVESNLGISDKNKRIPNVSYHTFFAAYPRLLNSRLSSLYSLFLIFSSKSRAKALKRKLPLNKPDAILTIAHGTTWLLASYLARHWNVPLHLVLHDDWIVSRSVYIPAAMRSWAEKVFVSVYKQAAYQWCISPEMEEYYSKKYGEPGTVLWPIRSKSLSKHIEPVAISSSHALRFVYAGSLHVPAYRKAIITLADVLAPLNCSLCVFTSLSKDALKALGLIHSNLSFHPFVEPENFVSTLRQKADVLFCPLSFETNESETRLSFPSKLADYTAVGLPILFLGPSDSPGIRWAKRNQNATYVVDNESKEDLEKAVKQLINSSDLRQRLVEGAIMSGLKYFRYENAIAPFYSALTDTPH